MNDTAIKNYCIWARAELLNEVENRMQRYGILEKGAEPTDAQTVGGQALSTQEQKQRTQLLEMQARMGHAALRDKAAYTWFNRIIAIRFMELHDYLPSGIHVFCSANDANAFEPEIVKEALDLDLPSTSQEEIVPLVRAGEDEPLFRYLFLAQCNELAECLPAVFEPVGSALKLLLPSGLLRKESVVGQLVAQLPWGGEAESGIGWSKVEILGWMYQFYNSEVKDEFFKSKRKATARDIAPATQLFTPEWIVRYMVENTLGRLWMLNNPESTLRESMEYYIEPDAEHEDFIRIEGPEDISLCDPACGSGHILVYAFKLLFGMYTERGYREREIPQLILQNNLTGMEIDPRAAQIANLALAMCAREHDRRFFARGVEADINVIAPAVFEEGELPEGAALLAQPQLVDVLAHLDEIGSLLNPTEAELSALRDDAQRFAEAGQASLFGVNVAEKLQQAKQTCETLARKFTCVVANPPYMGSSSFSPFMSKWIKKNYADVKSDLCTCFIERGFDLVQKHGYSAMVTMASWMFLGSFEELRKSILQDKAILSLVYMGHGLMRIAFNTSATVFYNGQTESCGAYTRLESADMTDDGRPIRFPADENGFYRRNAKTFTQIPGTPIAYWIGSGLLGAFSNGGRIRDEFTATVKGIFTGDNARFLRLWEEVDCSSINKGWQLYAKGGLFRKWYGNLDYVVDWRNDAYSLRSFEGSGLSPSKYFGNPTFTWSKISSGHAAFRYNESCVYFDDASPAFVFSGSDRASKMPWLAFANSSICAEALSLIAPTLNYQTGDVGKLPILDLNEQVDRVVSLVELCVAMSKSDWDSFETSWDFKRHPLV